MCGRFSIWSDKNKILEHYGLKDGPNVNIPPSVDISAVRVQNEKELVNLHWGLIPHWARDNKLQPINARADSVAKKPFFRDSFRHRRCLIPTNGYYEWTELTGKKQPYFIHLKDIELFSFAGIWSRWDSPEQAIESCAIITTDANKHLSIVHDRMPVIIDPDDYDQWLNEGGEEMLKPYAGTMEAYPVSTQVNSPKNQGAELINRL